MEWGEPFHISETLGPTIVVAKQDLESVGVDTEDNTNLRDAVSYLHFSDINTTKV